MRITPLGVEGDQHADRKHHGGEDKAVLAYSKDHYALWREELGWPHFGPGVLGENLVVEAQSEADACIGDRYRIGPVVVEVTQPRQPCANPARLHNYAPLTKLMAHKCRSGWYLRVLEPGEIAVPCPITLIDRPHPEWTILRALRLLYQNSEGSEAWVELGELPELSGAWKDLAAQKSDCLRGQPA